MISVCSQTLSILYQQDHIETSPGNMEEETWRDGAHLIAPEPYRGAKFANKYRSLGVAQIILGLLAIILDSIAISIVESGYMTFSPTTTVSSGIWCGILVFIAGILGVLSGRRPDMCLITTAMVVTIFAAITSGFMFFFEFIAAVNAGSYFQTHKHGRGHLSSDSAIFRLFFKVHIPSQRALVVLHAVMATIAFIQLVISTLHSVYCCTAKCCLDPGDDPTAVQENVNTIAITAVSAQVPDAAAAEEKIKKGQTDKTPQSGYQRLDEDF